MGRMKLYPPRLAELTADLVMLVDDDKVESITLAVLKAYMQDKLAADDLKNVSNQDFYDAAAAAGVVKADPNWGEINGSVTDQTDLVNYITNLFDQYTVWMPQVVAMGGDVTIDLSLGNDITVNVTGPGTISFTSIPAEKDIRLFVNIPGNDAVAITEAPQYISSAQAKDYLLFCAKENELSLVDWTYQVKQL